VKRAAESVAPSGAALVVVRRAGNQVEAGWVLVERTVRPMRVVVRSTRASRSGCLREKIGIRSRHSCRTLPTQRSACAFARGAAKGQTCRSGDETTEPDQMAFLGANARKEVKSHGASWYEAWQGQLRLLQVRGYSGAEDCGVHAQGLPELRKQGVPQSEWQIERCLAVAQQASRLGPEGRRRTSTKGFRLRAAFRAGDGSLRTTSSDGGAVWRWAVRGGGWLFETRGLQMRVRRLLVSPLVAARARRALRRVARSTRRPLAASRASVPNAA
jgi:hypothetical protein